MYWAMESLLWLGRAGPAAHPYYERQAPEMTRASEKITSLPRWLHSVCLDGVGKEVFQVFATSALAPRRSVDRATVSQTL